MQWLRKWLSGSAEPTKTKPQTFRPSLEALDARDLPSVSSVLTNTGLTQFIVDNTNSLIVRINGGAPGTVIAGTATTGVRTAQGFRTAGGLLGFDAVMMDGTWQHFEQGAGGALLPNGTYTTSQITGLPSGSRFLDVGSAYDAQGRLRLDLLVTSPGNTSTALNQTGVLFEFNQATGGGVQNLNLPNVRWVSTYLDTNGGTGIAVGQQFATGTPGVNELLVRKADAVAGLSTLFDGFAGGSAEITEYSQTVAPVTNVGTLPGTPGIPGTVLGGPGTTGTTGPSRVVIDVTFGADTSLGATFNPNKTYSLEYSLTNTSGQPPVINVLGVGIDNSIKPGG